jgi:hypothetical protein
MCDGAIEGPTRGSDALRTALRAEKRVLAGVFTLFCLASGLTRLVITILVIDSPFW